MATTYDPQKRQDIFLQPPLPRSCYCGFCDREVRTFCGTEVLQCLEAQQAGQEVPPDHAARGVVVGVGLGVVLWLLLVLGAWLVGVL